jgi:hypothetical protein
MPTFIIVCSLFIILVAIILALEVDPKWYLVAGLGSYVFSFLLVFSIGHYTLSLTFPFLVLGIVHSIAQVKQRKLWYFSLSVLSILSGFTIWLMISSVVTDTRLFSPITFIFGLFGYN